MPVRASKLREEEPGTWRICHRVARNVYLKEREGAIVFATALYDGLKWPILALMDGETVKHAGVRGPDGMFYDVRGPVSGRRLGKVFGCMPPYNLQGLSAGDLFQRTGLNYGKFEQDVHQARRIAEILWPEWPWDKFGPTERGKAFAAEYQALCRKYEALVYPEKGGNLLINFNTSIERGEIELKPLATDAFILHYRRRS